MGLFRRAKRAPAPAPRLIACPDCSAEHVVPVEWTEYDPQRWWMRLRCGECGATREVLVPDAEAQRYDAELDRGMYEIRAALHRLEQERAALDPTDSTAER